MYGPGIGINIGRPARRRGGQPALAARPHLAGVIPAAEAGFTSANGWSTHAALSVDAAAPGRAVVDGSAVAVQLDHAIAPLTPGRTYAIHVGMRDWVAGRFQIYLMGGGSNQFVGSNNYLAAHHLRVHQAAHPHDTIRVSLLTGNAAPQMAISDVQIYDVTDLITQPKAIIAHLGQSNRVNAFAVTGYDPDLDTPELRAGCIPSLQQLAIGTRTDLSGPSYSVNAAAGIGEWMPMTSPLSHASSTGVNAGDPPATTSALHEAKFLCDNWPLKYAGFAPCFVQAAATGTNFTSHWNYRFPDQSYLGLARANIAAALAAQPGNFLSTLVWQQGESWLGNHAAYNAEFRALIALLRAEFGDFNLVVAEIGGLRSDPNVAAMIETQQRLDQDSGHADALPFCRYVGRPDMNDLDLLEVEGGAYIHFNATAARLMGQEIGRVTQEMMLAR